MQTNPIIHYKKSGTGAAFDIGTTTVVGSLVDLSTGSVLRTLSLPNPQSKWGKDVVSRINAVVNDPMALSGLSASLVSVINEIIEGLSPDDRLVEITAAGNTVMEHMLLGVSPAPLARVPYRPVFTEARTVPAESIGIKAPGAELYVFPLIGGFVGGDAVSVILALGLHKKKEPALAIDIGTNSEIMLYSGDTLYAASAAAGPAFEGGEIKCGMSAGKGAIRGVKIEGDRVELDVIGTSSPKGICGSGLIDAASELVKAGVIEPSGRIKDSNEVDNNLSVRIRKEDGGNSFVLHKGPAGEVTLTQQDIRSLQTAKAAIKAGVLMLLKKASLKAEDVKEVFIAGAFGSNIKNEGLRVMGLLEPYWDKVMPAGDAALEGAVLALLSDELKREAEDIAGAVKYVSLSGSAHFEHEFIRNMDFRP